MRWSFRPEERFYHGRLAYFEPMSASPWVTYFAA